MYDNSRYWQDTHIELAGTNKAVGWCNLSEEFNKLRLKSESETFLSVVDGIHKSLCAHDRDLNILDIGSGLGYWPSLIERTYESSRFNISCIDISDKALHLIKANHPKYTVIQKDLKSIRSDLLYEKFDLVMSCYCMSHLTRIHDLLNALRFAGNSVKKDGYLLLMDPVITEAYSKYNTTDFTKYECNNMPRTIYMIDDIMDEMSLRRIGLHGCVSFCLNSNIEAKNRMGYLICRSIWNSLFHKVYMSDKRTKILLKLIYAVDKSIKRFNKCYSTKICIYKKY